MPPAYYITEHTTEQDSNMRALSDATAGLLKPMRLLPSDRLFIDLDETRRYFITYTKADGGIGWPSNDARVGWYSRVPERKQLENGHWKLAATDYTAEIINAVWPANQIEWLCDLAQATYGTLLLSTTLQDDNAEIYARFKENGAVPQHNLAMHPDFPLTPYQQVVAYCACRSEGYGELMEQGTGKTAPVITKICTHALESQYDSSPYMAIIICPKNVRTNWLREFERFATVAGEVNIIKGGKLDRHAQIIEAFVPKPDCRYSVIVMSYQALQRDIDFISNFQFDLAVADEAHNLASVKTKQHKAAMILRNISKCRMPLTGTPMANTPLDLYALFEFMGDGWSGFASWENFKNFYGVYASPDGDSYKKLVAIQNTPFMKERLARTSFIIRLEEAIPNLPPMLPDTYEVEMSGRQAEVYEALATQLAYEIENELDSSQNASITVNHVLTKLLRLAQVACGFVKYDEVVNPNTLEVLRESRIEFFNPNPKIDGLLDLLQGKNENQKTIIWSTFVPCIKVISEKFTQLGLPHVTFYGDTSDDARLEAERRFNCDVDCRLLIGNPAAGGSGLNLLGYPPHGGDNVPTKDEEIRIRVQKKSHTAFELTDIREILGNVLKSIRGVKEFAA
jgi:hypothetical protein